MNIKITNLLKALILSMILLLCPATESFAGAKSGKKSTARQYSSSSNKKNTKTAANNNKGSQAKKKKTRKTFINADGGKDYKTRTLNFTNFNGDEFKLKFAVNESEYEQYEQLSKYLDSSSFQNKLKKKIEQKYQEDCREDFQRLQTICGKKHVSMKQKNNGNTCSFSYPKSCSEQAKKYFNGPEPKKREKRNIKAIETYKKQLEHERETYLNSKGIKITKSKGKNIISPDYPALARNYRNTVQQAAEGLDEAFRRFGYSDRDIAGAVLSLVQTGITYKSGTKMDMEFFGLMLPAQALIEGYADCDGKSLLAATLLSYWPQIHVIGIQITVKKKGHYLIAADIPKMSEKEQTITYKGNEYVLMETTSRVPIGYTTLPKKYSIDEFF